MSEVSRLATLGGGAWRWVVGCLLVGVSVGALAAAPEVINAGIGGHSSANLRARLQRDVFSQQPDLVVLLVGTNDMLNPARFAPLATYHENLDALARDIRASGADLLLLTLPPCYPPYLFERHGRARYEGRDPNARIAEANEVIHELSRERGIPLVDLAPLFAGDGAAGEGKEALLRNLENSGTKDGVHPTPAGYRAIAAAVYEVMREQGLTGKRRILCLGDSLTYGAHMTGAGTASGDTYPAELQRLLAR